jgi:hypothetical protein
MGGAFEESVMYSFNFQPDGTYTMQWSRTFGEWSSQSEQHFGAWRLVLDQVVCETVDPQWATGDSEVPYAPAGYKFQVPINDILEAKGMYVQALPGSPAKPWEAPARYGKCKDEPNGATITGTGIEDAPVATGVYRSRAPPDAKFVEIDGEMHEVSGDIAANRP